MSNKRKRLARALAQKTGVSYQGAINLLGRNAMAAGQDVIEMPAGAVQSGELEYSGGRTRVNVDVFVYGHRFFVGFLRLPDGDVSSPLLGTGGLSGHPDGPMLERLAWAAAHEIRRSRAIELDRMLPPVGGWPIPPELLERAAASLPDPEQFELDAVVIRRPAALSQPDDRVINGNVAELRTVRVDFRRSSLEQNGASAAAWVYDGNLWLDDSDVDLAGGEDALVAFVLMETGAAHVTLGKREYNLTSISAWFTSATYAS